MSSRPLYRKAMPDLARRVLGDAPTPYLLGLPTMLPPVASLPPARRPKEAPVALPSELPASASLSVSASWRSAYDRGKQTWTTFGVSFEEFAAHLAELGHRDAPAYAVDLYLTVACRLGRRAALQVLEQEFMVGARAVVKGVVRDAWVVDDVLQDVRRRLFVGPRAKLACYRGTGSLASWIRAIATNGARDYLRSEAARRRRDERRGAFLYDAEEVPLQDENLAQCIVWQGAAPACIEAVRRAFQSLQTCDRQLLRDYYLRRLSIDALAPLYLVNRATVARRIRKCTVELGLQLRKRLALLYPRESVRTLDAIALAACRDLIVDPAWLLESPGVAARL